MPKSLRNIYDKKLNYIAFYKAHLRASNNKRNRKDVILFEMDLESNLMNLYNSIKNNTYHIGKYHQFIVREPKLRIIQSLPYVDRIVHQWYVEEFIIPYIVPKFINDTYACIKDKGTHKAVDKVQYYMRIMKRKYGQYYILKCDIKKYFYNIDRNILYSIMHRHIGDKKLLSFTKMLITDSTDTKGIPIGNYTSQYFANIYLNELDHYVKEQLQIKYYVRYMDDFIILVKTKEEARQIKLEIMKYLESHLKLELNRKSKYYPNNMGVDFCGYRIFETHRILRKRSKKKIRTLLSKATKDNQLGILNQEKLLMQYNSWLAHAMHANSYNLINKYNKIYNINKLLELDNDNQNETSKIV